VPVNDGIRIAEVGVIAKVEKDRPHGFIRPIEVVGQVIFVIRRFEHRMIHADCLVVDPRAHFLVQALPGWKVNIDQGKGLL